MTTTTIDNAREGRRLVRMYSGDVEGRLPYGSNAQVLGQVLGQNHPDPRDVANPWRKFFETWEPGETELDPITDVITIESNKLRENFLSFLTNCSGQDRLNLARSEPTMEGVIELVQEVTAAAQAKKDSSRRGKAMKYFHKFCRTVDSHKAMLEIIPQGSEYVSILAGTLTVVIQASINHERMAEDLSEALCSISEYVVECKVELELFRTQAMMKLIADFYAHIFVFLSDVMDWIAEKRRRRLLDSFNENFYQKFEDKIETIKRKSEMIRNLAAQSSRAEQRATRLTLEELAKDVRVGLVGEERRHAEMTYFAERMERELLARQEERQLQSDQQLKQLAERLTSMLQDKAVVWIGDMRSVNGGLPLGLTELQHLASPLQMLSGAGGYSRSGSPAIVGWTAEEVLLNSRHMEDFFHRDRIRLQTDLSSPTPVTSEALSRLAEWMKSQSSCFLWLEGPHTEADDFDNAMTILANKVVELAEEAHVPVVSCCELRRGERLRSGNDTREAQSTVALTCALLRQMVEHLLPRFETEIDLSASRLRVLDGSILCWSQMLQLFCDLLPLMPDTLLCVIDGLQWLGDRSTDVYLEELLQAMRGTKLRVLFTTTGRSVCLRKQLQPNETLAIEAVDLREAAWGLDRNNSWALTST
ncbi:Uu.00g042160.m01.CDS01 [Anthostomella pinea]|uniref:Uu.00g042160.m01.CDS01 n=1 Tax=Anthostomella pinea TaxID=933095 RepID=A0AAI8YE83_9PEZI|nr:Uu.00g042160.m01.CDS01 [Anthostomella pinea]